MMFTQLWRAIANVECDTKCPRLGSIFLFRMKEPGSSFVYDDLVNVLLDKFLSCIISLASSAVISNSGPVGLDFSEYCTKFGSPAKFFRFMISLFLILKGESIGVMSRLLGFNSCSHCSCEEYSSFGGTLSSERHCSYFSKAWEERNRNSFLIN